MSFKHSFKKETGAYLRSSGSESLVRGETERENKGIGDMYIGRRLTYRIGMLEKSFPADSAFSNFRIKHPRR